MKILQWCPPLMLGKYKLFKSIPLPVRQTFDETKYAIIQLDADYVALNEDSDSFYEFQEDKLKRCIVYEDTHICPAIFLLRKIRHTTSCSVELLLNEIVKENRCKIILRELRETYWKILTTPGNWIYSTTEKEPIRIYRMSKFHQTSRN